MSYSYIGFQCAYLATKFPSIYWNTACLRVDAGLEEEASTNYGKIAKAVGKIAHQGINFSLIDINRSEYMFEPDQENNLIVYGLKPLNGVGGDVIQEIINHRPYSSLQDFLDKTNVSKTVIISLIKSGAFDQFGERKDIMRQYLTITSNPKKRLNLQNFAGIIERDLVPQKLTFQKRVFVFNKALRKNKQGEHFVFKADNFYRFYSQFFDVDLLEPLGDKVGINQKTWTKLYNKSMEPAKAYLQEHQEDMLNAYNDSLFQEEWSKYAAGGYAKWEMESLGFYYHPHELAGIDRSLYDITQFQNLPTEPVVDYMFKRGEMEIPIYKTNRIVGTVIAKDELHSSFSILTPESGVVTVKLNRDHFALYNRRISEVRADGTKKVIEQGWFQKSTLVMVNGIRRGDAFFAKRYKRTNSHQLYKITDVSGNGRMEFTHLRYGDDEVDGQ